MRVISATCCNSASWRAAEAALHNPAKPPPMIRIRFKALSSNRAHVSLTTGVRAQIIRAITRIKYSPQVMPDTRTSRPRKLPRQSRSVAMVDAILEASARILLERGYAGMSTNAVAQCAGVSVGSLYQYFPNKESLLAALHDRHAEQMGHSIGVILAEPLGGAGLRGAIVRFVRAAMAAHEVEPELHRLLEKERPFFEGNAHSSGVDGEVHRHIQRLLEEHPSEVKHPNLAIAAWMIMRMTESLVHSAILYPPQDLDVSQVEPAIVDAIYAFLTYPLRSTHS
ncbi:TetR/AcrR family transcriptional regulator [Pseudomonas sp. SH1-B]